MNPRRLAGLAFLLAGALVLCGCSQPVRKDGHMFEHWADAVAAIPIDDGSHPATAAHADPKAGQTQAQTDPQQPMKIDLVDASNMPDSRSAGLRAAVAVVDSELAGLKRRFTGDRTPAAALAPAPTAVAASAPAAEAPAFMVQLAAFPTRRAAEGAWARLKAAHPDAFGALSARFEPVDLGARGVWTRLQAGPLPTREKASAVCAEAGVNDRWCVSPSRS